ncbi:hypothetical protein DUI87_22380 [Hirundo rustica rustica]|uniref:Uncharacterized protein n=1 Tax=Hirundo rustica rustica TaxID=333673 RepID=A0A3M0JPX7_HIRRU|nr:hypothetical protein DUI87_22380 [Hirundo rustica rustica]
MGGSLGCRDPALVEFTVLRDMGWYHTCDLKYLESPVMSRGCLLKWTGVSALPETVPSITWIWVFRLALDEKAVEGHLRWYGSPEENSNPLQRTTYQSYQD